MMNSEWKCKIGWLFLFLFPFSISAQKFDTLALTPPMGWNSWNKFACKGLNETVVREVADAMVSSGMKDAGYEYIVLDDCWQIARDENGNILADTEKFPSGIKALADYIHSKVVKGLILLVNGVENVTEQVKYSPAQDDLASCFFNKYIENFNENLKSGFAKFPKEGFYVII